MSKLIHVYKKGVIDTQQKPLPTHPARRHVGSAKDEALVYTPKGWCVSRVLMFPLQAVEKQVTKLG